MQPTGILSRFLKTKERLDRPPPGKSNYGYTGHLFATILFEELGRHIPRRYTLVRGPLWVHGLEWVEWDGAVTKSVLPDNSVALYEPEDIIALFEIKTRGVYGGEKEVTKALNNIAENFRDARKHCQNCRQCIYVTLQERKPKRETSVPYYQRTKDILEPVCLIAVLFESPVDNKPVSQAKPCPGEWKRLIETLQAL
ncbi:hypothetical protein ES703_103473 [subsurface metagenome]